jgi:uncharacterized membrane protein
MSAALPLALASSLAYGSADFLGGAATRGIHVLRVVVVAAPASLLVELVLWPAIGASFAPGALGWGAASGLASAAAFALLYRSLAIGPMSVLSPVTALISAALPVSVGFIEGEHLSMVAFAGVTLALIAVVAVSRGSGERGVRPTRTALVLAFGAGAAIAAQLVCLNQAPNGSGVAPLTSAGLSRPPSSSQPPSPFESESAKRGPICASPRPPAPWTRWRTSHSYSPSATAR